MNFTSDIKDMIPVVNYYSDVSVTDAQAKRSYGLTIASIRDLLVGLVYRHAQPFNVEPRSSSSPGFLVLRYTGKLVNEDEAKSFRSDLERLCRDQGLVCSITGNVGLIRGI